MHWMKHFTRLAGGGRLGVLAWACVASAQAVSQSAAQDFTPDQWDLSGAQVVDHLERRSLTGTAFLKDVAFGDGVLEVDVATTERTRSYPGVLFRVQGPGEFERVYLRPHRSPFYYDALQYAPTFNGVDSWQLYHGDGRTARLDIRPDRWNHLKIAVKGNRAAVYWNDDPKPALLIDSLAHGESRGTIGLLGPSDGSAFFSHFTFTPGEGAPVPECAPRERMCGIIAHWRMSPPFPLRRADFEAYPESLLSGSQDWKEVEADEAGLVDVSRHFARQSEEGDCIAAKTTLIAEHDDLLKVAFGYSDYITVFLNGKPVFSGNAAYRSRDLSFLGIVGYFDTLFLPLTKGENELVVRVGEQFGGWGFCFRKSDETFVHPALRKEWSVGDAAAPESVVYDPSRGVCYVSNYSNGGEEFLSRISPDGEVLDREWIKGLRRPTGMCLRGGDLYAVDRTGVSRVDIDKGEIVEKIVLPEAKAPNDAAMDAAGNLYVSDTQGNTVFKYSDGKAEAWLNDLDTPNALFVDGDFLLVGQTESVFKVRLKDKTVEVLARFEPGSNIDGIQPDGKGNWLVSNYLGKLYRVTRDGSKTLLLDTATPSLYTADFAFLPEQGLLIVPTLSGNSVDAYSLQ